MKRRKVFCAFLVLTTFGLVSACSHEQVRTEQDLPESMSSASMARPAPEVVVRQPPPAPREEMRPPGPSSSGYAWVPGYWTRGHNEWVWVQGRWERPPERTATWVPGQWMPRGAEWVWRNGHWE